MPAHGQREWCFYYFHCGLCGRSHHFQSRSRYWWIVISIPIVRSVAAAGSARRRHIRNTNYKNKNKKERKNSRNNNNKNSNSLLKITTKTTTTATTKYNDTDDNRHKRCLVISSDAITHIISIFSSPHFLLREGPRPAWSTITAVAEVSHPWFRFSFWLQIIV